MVSLTQGVTFGRIANLDFLNLCAIRRRGRRRRKATGPEERSTSKFSIFSFELQYVYASVLFGRGCGVLERMVMASKSNIFWHTFECFVRSMYHFSRMC